RSLPDGQVGAAGAPALKASAVSEPPGLPRLAPFKRCINHLHPCEGARCVGDGRPGQPSLPTLLSRIAPRALSAGATVRVSQRLRRKCLSLPRLRLSRSHRPHVDTEYRAVKTV